jgi:hypothetical protein
MVLLACVPSTPLSPEGQQVQFPAEEEAGTTLPEESNDKVVKGSASLKLVLGADGHGKGEVLAMTLVSTAPGTQEINLLAPGGSSGTPVSVGVAVDTRYALDISSFVAAPTIIAGVVSFGTLGIDSGFTDNNLKVCGTGGSQKCTKAAIQAYMYLARVDWTRGALKVA